MSDNAISILLVEDNPGDARLLRELLAEVHTQYFTVKVVQRLREAKCCLVDDRFDIILLDLSLPDSIGFDTFHHLHQQAADTPIIVLTGMNDETLALKAVQSGAQDYLIKGEVSHQLLARAIRYGIERHRMQRMLHSMSLLDNLTGLYNHRGFYTLAEQQMKIAQRTHREIALLFADLDGLKLINDSGGHQQGDLVLAKTAEILKHTFRYSDIVARLGGDEFAVLVIDAPWKNVQTILLRLQHNIDAYNLENGSQYPLSLSYGMAHVPSQEPITLTELITRADVLMYEQKRGKRHHARIGD